MRLLTFVFSLSLVSCAWTWEKEDFCDTGGCDACTSDDECVVGYSCCGEVFYCMHRDEQLLTCQLACPVPREPSCSCIEGQCRFD